MLKQNSKNKAWFSRAGGLLSTKNYAHRFFLAFLAFSHGIIFADWTFAHQTIAQQTLVTLVLPAEVLHKSVGKSPVGKSPVGKSPVGKSPVGKSPVGKSPPTEIWGHKCKKWSILIFVG